MRDMLWKVVGNYKSAGQSTESSGRLYDHFSIKGLKKFVPSKMDTPDCKSKGQNLLIIKHQNKV